MAQVLLLPQKSKATAGYLGVGGVALLYAAMYALNYMLPLQEASYTARIWGWSQAVLAAVAGVAAVYYRQLLTPRIVWLGLGLGLLSGLAHWLSAPSFWWNAWRAAGTVACFVGGALLFQQRGALRVAAFAPGQLGRSLVLGGVAALPLALINNLYFYATSGARPLESPLTSAFAALSPGIHEEIIYRFFVLALCGVLLRDARSPRLALGVAIGLAVVPHSLNHLPDLLLHNPAMGLVMLFATSLLFGLPMALLQIKRNLETAIAFHWCIDFARFLFGY